MAKYRQIHTSFWNDGFVLDLTPEEKFFYLYLMTNPKTSQCGIYELPKRIIETETGYNRETIQKLLQRFVDYEKVDYFEGTQELMIKNWCKYNPPNNINSVKCINKELKEVKNIDFVRRYIKSCIECEYEMEGLIRGLQGAMEPLPSNKIINNKEEVISNKQQITSNEEVAISSDDLSQVINVFNKTGFGVKSQFQVDKLQAWIEEYSSEWVIKSLENAAMHNAFNLSYVEATLQKWKAKGGMDIGKLNTGKSTYKDDGIGISL